MRFIDITEQVSRYRADIDREIKDVLDSGNFILGEKVSLLEQTLSRYVQSPYALGVASGTDALLMALMALDVGPGDEVITTPFTFFATGEVIAFLGAKPVFVDIDRETYCISPQNVEKVITQKTKAIIPVSLYGQCAYMEEFKSLEENYKLPVIEDGAQSFGGKSPNGFSGAITSLGTTSFFPAKTFGGFGDGGMIFCRSEEMYNKLKSLRVHGQSARYMHNAIGINGRLDALQAAILLAKWPHFEKEVMLRQEVANRYDKGLDSLKDIRVPKVLDGYRHIYAQYTLSVKNRESFVKELKESDIPTAVHYPLALHQQEVFKDLGYVEGDLPVSERAAKEVVSLPMHPYLSLEDQNKIIETIRAI